jgi:hypothetical protein
VTPGSPLDNAAEITTTVPEDTNFPNTATAGVVTPIPDPFITKRATPLSVMPGASFDYIITYGNVTDERAGGVYIVDGLPDLDGDGFTDITLLSVIVPNQEVVYY